MKLFGRTWTRRELEARVGRIEQIGGLRKHTLQEGPEAGTEQIEVRTGAGLRYVVSSSRGMDISLAEYAGTPISWQSGNGDVHPAYYDPNEAGWLRSAAGGLLMTCGLVQVGNPCEDEGERLGLHGRIHHTPARQVCAYGEWEGDEYVMTIKGVMEETSMFGGSLRLTRLLRSTLGDNSITIEDAVENIGFSPCPHMILYHFNFGFPLLSPATSIDFGDTVPIPREQELPTEGYNEWEEPVPNVRERVYEHRISGDRGRVTIHNPSFPTGNKHTRLKVALSWKTDTLPRLVQWHMPGEAMHVLGIEPANCGVGGRRTEREQGTLAVLAPGERREYKLQFKLEESE